MTKLEKPLLNGYCGSINAPRAGRRGYQQFPDALIKLFSGGHKGSCWSLHRVLNGFRGFVRCLAGVAFHESLCGRVHRACQWFCTNGVEVTLEDLSNAPFERFLGAVFDRFLERVLA